jgi:hypothetical protein
LWGATEPEIWRPPSKRVVLLRGSPGLEEISVGEVMESVRRMGGV